MTIVTAPTPTPRIAGEAIGSISPKAGKAENLEKAIEGGANSEDCW